MSGISPSHSGILPHFSSLGLEEELQPETANEKFVKKCAKGQPLKCRMPF